MSRGVQRCRLDGNHGDVMKALLASGMKAVSTAAVGSGFPDICVGFRGLTVMLEVKDGSKPPSARTLTADERNFHETWPGHIAIVGSPEEAVCAVVDHATKLGVL